MEKNIMDVKDMYIGGVVDRAVNTWALLLGFCTIIVDDEMQAAINEFEIDEFEAVNDLEGTNEALKTDKVPKKKRTKDE